MTPECRIEVCDARPALRGWRPRGVLGGFMEFAPIAALEAAAIPHKFPVGYIYLREETTDRVARVAFADAEPIAARYLASNEDAVGDMNDALIWH